MSSRVPGGRHPVLPGNLTVQQRDSSYKVPVTRGAPERLPGTTKPQAGLCLEEVSEQSNQDSIGAYGVPPETKEICQAPDRHAPSDTLGTGHTDGQTGAHSWVRTTDRYTMSDRYT